MKFKATPAQNIALHTLQSVGLSALVTFIVGLGQFVALHGLDWPQLTSFAAGGFLAAMSMMWKTLSGNPTASQNTMQAILDTVGELKNASQSPVTIHNNLPAPALSQPTASKDWVLTPSSIVPASPPVSAPAPQAQPISAPPAVAGQSTLQFATPAPFPYAPSSTYPEMPRVQP